MNEKPANSDNPKPQAGTDLPSRQCTAIKKDGERCKAPSVIGEETCSLHGSRAAEIRAKAVQASAEARRAKVEAREEAQEEAKLTQSQTLRLRAAERQAELVASLLDRAVDGDMRAQSIIWERLEGKVTDRLEVDAGNPFEMSQEQLWAWLNHAPTEQPTLPDSPKSDD